MDTSDSVKAAVSRVIELEAELESAGEASTHGTALAFARAELHKWVDTVVGVVSSPGSGRVMLIHENGRESSISSADLPFMLTRPAQF